MDTSAPTLTDERIAELRAEHYNATITHLEKPNPRLLRVRVRLDEGVASQGLGYEPGQYTTIGLGYWEPRSEEAEPETHTDKTIVRVAKRAYSISCRLLDESGGVAPAGDEAEPEFYIALVTSTEKHPPALTPRLFLLGPGDRVQVGPRPKGKFVLGDPDAGGVRPTDDVLFAATGTGEAPHNAMLARLLGNGHQGRIASVCCARYRSDLGYLDEHRVLMERYPNYRYVALTTREPENRDPDHPAHVGVRYVQDLLAADNIEAEIGFPLDPERAKVFLCGNPAMIGIPNKPDHPDGRYPKPLGAVEVLEGLGFRSEGPQAGEEGLPANIHYEKYW